MKGSPPLENASCPETVKACHLATSTLRRRRLTGGEWRGEFPPDPLAAADFILLGGARDSEMIQRLAEPLRQAEWTEPDAAIRAYWALRVAGRPPRDHELVALRSRIPDRVVPGDWTLVILTGAGLAGDGGVFPGAPAWIGSAGSAGQPPTDGFLDVALPLAILTHADTRPRFDGSINPAELPVYCAARFAEWERFLAGRGLPARLRRFLGRVPSRAQEIAAARGWLARRSKTFRERAELVPLLLATSAMEALGMPPDHLAATREALLVECGGGLKARRRLTPLHDTALARRALAESGCSEQSDAESWPAEFPTGASSVEDVAAVLLARGSVELVEWLTRLQSSTGGWAPRGPVIAGDTPLDILPGGGRACPGATGQVLEAIATRVPPIVSRRAVGFLTETQELDGSWRLARGGGRVEATANAAAGLAAAGEGSNEPHLLRAAEWLRSAQNADGGWGDAPDGVAGEEFTRAGSGPVATARALIGLRAAGDVRSDVYGRGIQYLLECQNPAGHWQPEPGTNTVEAMALPLLALTRHLGQVGETQRKMV